MWDSLRAGVIGSFEPLRNQTVLCKSIKCWSLGHLQTVVVDRESCYTPCPGSLLSQRPECWGYSHHSWLSVFYCQIGHSV